MTNISSTRTLSPIQAFHKEVDSMHGEIADGLATGPITPERFIRVLKTAVQQSLASNYTNLLECDRRSLWMAALKAASDGLLPDGREGAIIRYGDKAQWLPMVAGIRKKARNSGEISTWDVHCVYKNDHFILRLGDSPSIEHTYDLAQDRGELIGAYSVALLKDGSKSYEVMSIGEIRAIRDRSQAWQAYVLKKVKTTPWATDEAEMARKTVAKRHAKQLPSSADLDDIIRGDNDSEFERAAETDSQNVTPLPRAKPKGKQALDQFANQIEHKPEAAVNTVKDAPERELVAVDAETGEVLEEEQEAGPSAADAYELGRKARMAKRALKATPPEWRENPDAAPLLEAWKAGWEDTDKELASQ